MAQPSSYQKYLLFRKVGTRRGQDTAQEMHSPTLCSRKEEAIPTTWGFEEMGAFEMGFEV